MMIDEMSSGGELINVPNGGHVERNKHGRFIITL